VFGWLVANGMERGLEKGIVEECVYVYVMYIRTPKSHPEY
jgi:hypothetical protein